MTDIIQIVELDVERVDGVESPASGFPFFILKATDDKDNGGAQKEMEIITPTHTDTQNLADKSGLPGTQTPIDGDLVATPPTAQTIGGQNTRAIPIEAKVRENAIVALKDKAEQAMSKFVKQIEAVKSDDEPGSTAWESDDSENLTQISESLASACASLDVARQREETEGTTVDGSDMSNAYDLSEAQQAIDYALGIAARLSFHEATEASEKSTDHGHVISMDITKDELATLIAEGTTKAVAEALKAQKGEEMPDIGGTVADPTAGVAHADANDVPSPAVDPEYVNKAEIDKLSETIATMGETLKKIADRPRTGGPILDGQVHTDAPVDPIARLATKWVNEPDLASKEMFGKELAKAQLTGKYEEMPGLLPTLQTQVAA